MKFYGKLGFAKTIDCGDGTWREVYEEREYLGDVYNPRIRRQPTDKVIDNVLITNQISIVYDQFAVQNMMLLRYVVMDGTCWSVTEISVEPPRLVLSIAGVFNKDEAPTESAE